MSFAMQCSSYAYSTCLSLSFHANYHCKGLKSPPRNHWIIISAALEDRSSNLHSERKRRKVVEHVCLLKAKEELSEEEENDMIDYLYRSRCFLVGKYFLYAISL